MVPAVSMTPAAAVDHNETKDIDIIPPPQRALTVTEPSNEATEESDLENAELI